MKNNILRIAVLLIASCIMGACGNKKVAEPTNSMVYRQLGNTGLEVSEISIGCGCFEKMDTAQSRMYMTAAIDSGINYIDIYDANPLVRGNIGYALQGRRDKMIIQGHIGSYWNGAKYERTRDVEKCKEGFGELLRLLGTDHIEVGMMHIVDNMDEWNEIVGSEYLAYVKQLKSEGKIEHIGVSSHNAEVALAAAKSGLVEVIMFSLNPAFDRLTSKENIWDPESYNNILPGIDPVRVQLYDYCASHKIAITVMKVFGGGGKLLDASTSPIKVALTPVQCISYALDKPCVATAICGADNIEELNSDLAYLYASDEEKDYNAVLSNGEAKAACSGDCTYCNHCSPCPAGIDISKVNELLDKATKEGKVTKELEKEYKALEHHASECTACGACEGRCPFDVPVREKMKEAVKIFGL